MTVVTQYVSSIGTFGTGNDQFKFPEDITTDGTYLYIADSGNQRIQKRLASDLSFVAKTISASTYSGKGICTDGTNVYSACTVGDIVVRLDTSLVFSGAAGGTGTGVNDFQSPIGICVSGGFLWIVDQINHRIIKRSATTFIVVAAFGTGGAFGSQGSGDDQFSYPCGIATDGTYLYIGDSGNSRVFKRDLACAYVAQYGTQGQGNDQFGTGGDFFNTEKIYCSVGGGYLIASDPGFFPSTPGPYYNNRLHVRSTSDLSYASQVGAAEGPWFIDQPHGSCISGGFLYVCDTGNSRIVKYSIGTVTAPTNDDFANRTTISVGSYAGSTLGATLEAGEVACNSLSNSPTLLSISPTSLQGTVWYQLTAPNDGNPHLYEISASTVGSEIFYSDLHVWILKCQTCPPTSITDLYQPASWLYEPVDDGNIPPTFATEGVFRYAVLHPNETVYVAYGTAPGNGIDYTLDVTEVTIAPLGRQLVAGATVVNTGSASFSGDFATPAQYFIDIENSLQWYRVEGLANQPFSVTVTGVPGSDHGGVPDLGMNFYWPSVSTPVRLAGVPENELEFVDQVDTPGSSPSISSPSGWLLDSTGVAYILVYSADFSDQGQFTGAVTFSTAPVVTLTAVDLENTTATLTAVANPNGVNSEVYFEYGPTTSYGMQTATTPVGSGTAYVQVAQSISGLTAGTAYNFRAALDTV